VQTQRLKTTLQEEARYLNDFASHQKSLQETIRGHRWMEIDSEVAALRELAGKIEQLEASRLQAYEELRDVLQARGPEEFPQIVARLPRADRDELLALHRKMRAAVIRVKASAGLLAYYVRSMSDTLRQVLEELLPHRKGKLYSRSGRTKDAGEEPLMLYRNA
jgi:ribosomal 50S subunit-associated protein YjgA (DUF615 family)